MTHTIWVITDAVKLILVRPWDKRWFPHMRRWSINRARKMFRRLRRWFIMHRQMFIRLRNWSQGMSMHGRLPRGMSVPQLGLWCTTTWSGNLNRKGCLFSESDCNIQFQCDDIDDNDDFHRCEDGLAEELSKCFDSCGGISSCIIACSTDYENGLKECPCMEGCPGGCPCENWDCTVQVLYFTPPLIFRVNLSLVWSPWHRRLPHMWRCPFNRTRKVLWRLWCNLNMYHPMYRRLWSCC